MVSILKVLQAIHPSHNGVTRGWSVKYIQNVQGRAGTRGVYKKVTIQESRKVGIPVPSWEIILEKSENKKLIFLLLEVVTI